MNRRTELTYHNKFRNILTSQKNILQYNLTLTFTFPFPPLFFLVLMTRTTVLHTSSNTVAFPGSAHVKPTRNFKFHVLHKTELCMYHERGTCKRSRKECAFAHGLEDMRVLTPEDKEFLGIIPDADAFRTLPCRYWLAGFCKYGARCTFLHGHRPPPPPPPHAPPLPPRLPLPHGVSHTFLHARKRLPVFVRLAGA